jgi:hypothetical protein
MSSLKCPQCGLVNFATAPACKRCKLPFNDGAQVEAQPSQNAYAQDPYTQAPYAPQQQYGSDSALNVWRDGSQLVAANNTTLPERCIKCNAPASTLLKRTVEWYPPYVLLIFLLVHIAGIILYCITRKRATLYIGLCEAHLNRRRFGLLIGICMLVGSVLFFWTSVTGDAPQWALLAVIVFMVGLCVTVSVWRIVKASKIEEPYVWLKGINSEFLETLPPA